MKLTQKNRRCQPDVSLTPATNGAMLGCGIVFLALSACGKTPELDSVHESGLTVGQALGADDSTPTPTHDGPSPQSITVTFRSAGARNVGSLTGRVLNATSETKIVTLALIGVDPYGREVSRPFGMQTVPPKSSRDVVIPARDLPVQSAGQASIAAIAANYELVARLPDGSSKTLAHRVHSPPLYVTFSESFATATALTTAEQARAAGSLSSGSLAKPTRLRRYNEAYDRIDEVDAVPTEGEPPALLGVTDVAPGPLPPTSGE